MSHAVLRGVRAAFVFLTRIPLPGEAPDADAWRWAPAHFPLVGLVLGSVLGAAFALLRLGVGSSSAAWLVVALGALLTGAFHEDGLADTSDALGGAFDRDKLFAILKDSRVGTFGALALVVKTGAAAGLVAELDADAPPALAFAHATSRFGPVLQMACLPYAHRPGEHVTRDLAGANSPQVCVAMAWGLSAGGLAWAWGLRDPARLASACLLPLALTALLSWRFLVRAGGIRGDFLGATQQVGEVAALVALAWGRSR